ncbi:hypothetical protein, partial [Pseudomonas aeruginosa]|uniref:hypothetical protein n=1 Tax=Pseudomonas aeruginosa TaxID=287 RepID=UPI00301C6592
KPGDEVQVVSEAAGFFVLDEVPHCSTSYSVRCWQWLNVTAMSQSVCWRLSWQAWTNRVSQNLV